MRESSLKTINDWLGQGPERKEKLFYLFLFFFFLYFFTAAALFLFTLFFIKGASAELQIPFPCFVSESMYCTFDDKIQARTGLVFLRTPQISVTEVSPGCFRVGILDKDGFKPNPINEISIMRIYKEEDMRIHQEEKLDVPEPFMEKITTLEDYREENIDLISFREFNLPDGNFVLFFAYCKKNGILQRCCHSIGVENSPIAS